MEAQVLPAGPPPTIITSYVAMAFISGNNNTNYFYYYLFHRIDLGGIFIARQLNRGVDTILISDASVYFQDMGKRYIVLESGRQDRYQQLTGKVTCFLQLSLIHI